MRKVIVFMLGLIGLLLLLPLFGAAQPKTRTEKLTKDANGDISLEITYTVIEPVPDTAQFDAKIARLTSERNRLNDEIDSLRSKRKEWIRLKNRNKNGGSRTAEAPPLSIKIMEYDSITTMRGPVDIKWQAGKIVAVSSMLPSPKPKAAKPKNPKEPKPKKTD